MENRILLTNNSVPVLLLDGVNDYAQVSQSPSLNLATSDNTFTIEGSFYVATLSDNQNRRLLTKSQEYDVGIVFSDSSADYLYFAVYNAFTFQRVTFGGNTNLAAGWHHFAATTAESASAFPYELNIYLDGTRIATRVNAPVVNVTANALVVGGAGGGAGAYKGFMDEVRLSDSVRYSGAMYTVPDSPFVTDANTRALWHFDEAAGSTTFVDASSNGNTLTGLNGAQNSNAPFNNSPVFTSTNTASIPENTMVVKTVTATDEDLPPQTVTFSIVDGADQSEFGITPSGALMFNEAPDFEAPTDANGDNVYVVTVQASDGSGGTTTQTIEVTVTPVNDNNPVFTSASAVNVPENTTAVMTVTATDADLPAQTVTFSLSGGADQSKFGITSAGVLTFNAAPDFEAPADADGDNIYVVTVQASDGSGGTTTQTIEVTVTPLPGDVNIDGLVNIFDVNLVSAHWGKTGPVGDANHDGIVNIFDVNLISANWTTGGGSGELGGGAETRLRLPAAQSVEPGASVNPVSGNSPTVASGGGDGRFWQLATKVWRTPSPIVAEVFDNTDSRQIAAQLLYDMRPAKVDHAFASWAGDRHALPRGEPVLGPRVSHKLSHASRIASAAVDELFGSDGFGSALAHDCNYLVAALVDSPTSHASRNRSPIALETVGFVDR